MFAPPIPNTVWAAAGAAEGDTELNAFDNALLAAQIGNLNLIRVSSVLPQDATSSTRPLAHHAWRAGADRVLVPLSSAPGETVAAAVGIGVAEGSHGMIYESHGGSRRRAEDDVRKMLEASFARRGLRLKDVSVRSIEHRVERIGCAVAAVVLWWR